MLCHRYCRLIENVWHLYGYLVVYGHGLPRWRRFKSRKNIIFRITREARVNVLCLEFNCQFRFLGIGLYFIPYSNIDIFLLATKVNCAVGCDLLKNLLAEKKSRSSLSLESNCYMLLLRKYNYLLFQKHLLWLYH